MEKKMTIETMKNKISNFFKESSEPPTISATVSAAVAAELDEEGIAREKQKRDDDAMTASYKKISAAIPLAVAIIPVVAGVLYIKDRKKILNANTGDAFMSMGNGNF